MKAQKKPVIVDCFVMDWSVAHDIDKWPSWLRGTQARSASAASASPWRDSGPGPCGRDSFGTSGRVARGIVGSSGPVQRELEKVAPSCRWTKGTWETLGLAWNELQNTPPT